MNNPIVKPTRLSAVIVLSLCMLCTNNVKTYAQPTLSFTPSNGNSLTFEDIFLQLIDYVEQGVYEMGWPYKAYTEANEIDETAFAPTPVVSISAPKVEKIGRRAFMNCILTEVDFPSVLDIGNEAFMLCHSLTNIDLPFCQTMGEGVFDDCKNLRNAELPRLIGILKNTFTGCSALESIYIPRVGSIYKHAFAGCTKLSSSWGELAPLDDWFEIEASDIYEYAFRGCKSIKKLSCPNLKYVYEASFSGCTGITELKLPLATEIESEAFGECSSLQKLSLPATESIAMFAFIDCTGLTELALPKIKSIGAYAFMGCPNIWKVSFGKGHTEAQMIALSERIFNAPELKSGDENDSPFQKNTATIELELGENVLPKPSGNIWNGYTWKSVTVVSADTTVEIKEVTLANTLSVYPNPVTEQLRIECKDAVNGFSTEYTIYNIMGQIVMQGELQREVSTLNVESLENGMYFLRIAEQTVKFVKE